MAGTSFDMDAHLNAFETPNMSNLESNLEFRLESECFIYVPVFQSEKDRFGLIFFLEEKTKFGPL